MLKRLWRLILRLFNFKDKGAKVPQGVQVFDDKGVIQLDTSDRVTNLLTTVERSGSSFEVVYSNDLFLSNDYFYILSPPYVPMNNAVLMVDTSISGNTLTISVTNNDRPRKIYIGTY